jgi:hypothetical protein
MQLRERTIQRLQKTQNEAPNHRAIPQDIPVGRIQGPGISPSRTIPVQDAEVLVPQLQSLTEDQRLLVNWKNFTIVATLVSTDRHIMILRTTSLTPPNGTHVQVSQVGSISGLAHHLQMPWLVHNCQARVDHVGAYTRLILIR